MTATSRQHGDKVGTRGVHDKARAVLASGAAVASAYFLGVLLLLPLIHAFELNTDEGINLQKARLVNAGYALYTEVWSDQPPLLTWMLAGTQRVSGGSVVAGRVLVLAMCGVLIGALFGVVRRSVGVWAAIVSAAALAMSQGFLTLSVSVMVGLPALAFAMVAVWLVRLYGQKKRGWMLAASGVCMALSMMTKMFTGFLVPLLLLEVVRLTVQRNGSAETGRRAPAWWTACLLWAGCFTAVMLAIWFGSGLNYGQLVGTHVAAQDVEALEKYDGSSVVPEVLMQNWVIIGFAVVGVVFAIVGRRWDAALPGGWLGIALVILLNHQPVWPHHGALLTIPLAWLAGYSVLTFAGLGSVRLSRRAAVGIGAAGVAVVIPAMIYVLPKLASYGEGYDDDRRIEVVETVRERGRRNPWIITDDSMIAVRAGLLTPPQATVLSNKRRRSDPAFDQTVISAIEAYEPGQIMLRHDVYSPVLIAFIERRYERVTDFGARLYYVLPGTDQPDYPTPGQGDAPAAN